MGVFTQKTQVRLSLRGLVVRTGPGEAVCPWELVVIHANQRVEALVDGTTVKATLPFLSMGVAGRLCRRARRRAWLAGTLSINPPGVPRAGLVIMSTLLLALAAMLVRFAWHGIPVLVQSFSFAPWLTIAIALGLLVAGGFQYGFFVWLVITGLRINAKSVRLDAEGFSAVVRGSLEGVRTTVLWDDVDHWRRSLFGAAVITRDGRTLRFWPNGDATAAMKWTGVQMVAADERPMSVVLRNLSIIWLAGMVVVGVVTRLFLPNVPQQASWWSLAGAALALPALLCFQVLMLRVMEDPRCVRRWWMARRVGYSTRPRFASTA